MAGTDFSHLTNDELIKGIQALKLPDYIRSKAYGIDVRESLAQMTEMTIQLGINMGLSPDDALEMVKKLQDVDGRLDIEKARIDSFTSLASGSTTGDAELIDGRIGADGKTYSNIGGAIRGQFGGLKNGLTSFAGSYDASVGGRSITDNVTIMSGSRLNSSGGLLGDHTYSYTDYHEVDPSTTYNLNWVASLSARICEYDADKEFVKATTSGNVLNTASNTKFIRYDALTTDIYSRKIITPIILHPRVINSALNEILTGNVFDGESYSNGYYTNTGFLVNSEAFRNTAIPVSKGDVVRWKYETADLENQNGVLFSGGSFNMPLKDFQKNVNNEYYEATIPDGVDTAHINFKNPSTFVVVKNTPYRDDAKYGKISIPNLDIDIDDNVVQALSNADVSLRNDVPYSKIFRNVCCIGDSITHGYYGDKDGVVYGTYKDYAYPAFLSKIIDAEVTNLGLSGRTAKSWYEQYSTAFSSDKTDWSKYDAFIIFLGTNGGLDGDINANAGNETQMGYYCRIIEMIQNANSEASIFLCTSPWTQSRDYFSNFTNQVIALGEAYSLPVLRLDQSQILTYENRLINQPYDRVLHFGRVGLMRMASEIARCIDDYGSATPAYFNKLYGVKS